MGLRSLRFLSLFFTSLALGPALAHFIEGSNQKNVSGASDLAVQQLYSEWTMFGIIIACAMISTLILTIMVLNKRKAFTFTFIAFLCLAGAQVVFWAITSSANQATGYWTRAPGNWPELRQQWEFLQATGAILNFTALASLNLSLITREPSIKSVMKSARGKELKLPTAGAVDNAQTQFLQNVASFHSSWYEVRLAEFRRATAEKHGRYKSTAA